VHDVYDTSGVKLPEGPYQAKDNSPGGHPIIPNSPASRTTYVSGTDSGGNTVYIHSDVQENFNIDLHTISLGPTLKALKGKWSGSLSAGATANIASWDASYKETVYATSNGRTRVLHRYRANNSATCVLPGLYVQADVRYQMNKNWSLFAAGRYDWSKNLKGSVGPSEFDLDLGGWTLMGGVGFNF
jgi:hypothetical protein